MANFLYNPDQKSKKQLKEEFVVRTDILDDIMSDIESSDMSKPEQHYLLVGQRGTGKTTMLLRIKYAIEDSEKLKDFLIPISFNEEQYNITELANLWESVAHFLEDYHGFTGLSEEMGKQYEKPDFEERCYEILEKSLKENNKKILLLIDNIGDLFKKIGDKEVRRLREILQTKKYVRLIAGSPFYLDNILDYTQPFFEFFKIKRLDGLNQQETEKLLLKLGDVYDEKEKIERIITKTPERIETLRILTTGVPRTIALMFRIFIDHEHESSIKDLERVLDAVTPLYKHRMDDLPTQQQKIIDAVAKNWDAISVKELKPKVRLDSKVISAQLRQLEKNQVIEKRETGTKNHVYLLRERFWNIWYLMRYGRKTDSERVIWLVRFLESWCSKDDFEKRIETYISQINGGQLDEETVKFYAEVYTSLKDISTNQKYLLKKNIPHNIANRITISEQEAVDQTEKFSNEGKHEDAIKVLLNTKNLSFENKKLLSEKIEKIEFEKLTKLGKEILVDLETTIVGGHKTFLLELLFRAVALSLVRKDLEMADTMLNLTPQILKLDDEKLDYEYNSLIKLVMVLLLNKKFTMSFELFNTLENINLKEKLKPHYYVTLFNLKDSKSESINLFGKEIEEASLNIMNTLKGYWETSIIDNQ